MRDMDTKKIRGQSQTVNSDFPAVEDPGGSLNHPFRFAGNLFVASLISGWAVLDHPGHGYPIRSVRTADPLGFWRFGSGARLGEGLHAGPLALEPALTCLAGRLRHVLKLPGHPVETRADDRIWDIHISA
jgi:hypothetical protein